MKKIFAAAAFLFVLSTPAFALDLDRSPEVAGWMEHAVETILSGSHRDAALPAEDASGYLTEAGWRSMNEAMAASGNERAIRDQRYVWRTDVRDLRVLSDETEDGVRRMEIEAKATQRFLGGRNGSVVRDGDLSFVVVQNASSDGIEGMRVRNLVLR